MKGKIQRGGVQLKSVRMRCAEKNLQMACSLMSWIAMEIAVLHSLILPMRMSYSTAVLKYLAKEILPG